MAFVYMLKCTDGSYYTGSAVDVKKRIKTHLSGSGAAAKYTRSHTVFEVSAIWETSSLSSAGKLEYFIKKKLTHSEKERLVLNPETLYEYVPEALSALGYIYYGNIANKEIQEMTEKARQRKTKDTNQHS